MNFLRWSEWIFVLVVIIILITQVAWPLVRGTRLFPVFRRENELERELEARRQAELEKNLERKLGKKHDRQSAGK